MHTWRVLVPHRSLRYLYKVIGCFVPRSGSPFLVPDPHSLFRILVPHSGYNIRFITPSPPSEKEALLNPYITRNRELLTLSLAILALPYTIILKVLLTHSRLRMPQGSPGQGRGMPPGSISRCFDMFSRNT